MGNPEQKVVLVKGIQLPEDPNLYKFDTTEIDKKIENNSNAIQENSRLIQMNGDAIRTNAELIQSNAKAIETNGGLIQTNGEAISTNIKNIAKNESKINILKKGAYEWKTKTGVIDGNSAVTNLPDLHTSSLVIVSPTPTPDNVTSYAEKIVYCSSQGEGKLTFASATGDEIKGLSVNIMWSNSLESKVDEVKA